MPSLFSIICTTWIHEDFVIQDIFMRINQLKVFLLQFVRSHMRSEPAKPDKSTMKNSWENEKNKKHDFKEDLNDD